jgi:hypothetical protein
MSEGRGMCLTRRTLKDAIEERDWAAAERLAKDKEDEISRLRNAMTMQAGEMAGEISELKFLVKHLTRQLMQKEEAWRLLGMTKPEL